jgi:hypothetical protein
MTLHKANSNISPYLIKCTSCKKIFEIKFILVYLATLSVCDNIDLQLHPVDCIEVCTFLYQCSLRLSKV